MRGKCFARTLLLGAVLLAAACRPDVGATPDTYVPVISAVFDPTNGVVPMPNNVLISTLPAGGVGIQVPTTLATTDADGNAATVAAFTPTMEEFVKSYLNKLDAFPVDMPMTVAFSKITTTSGANDGKAPPVVDKTTLTAKTFKVYDVTELLAGTPSPNVPEITGLAIGDLADVTGATGLTTSQAIVKPPVPWTPGHTYAAFVTTGVLDTNGNGIVSAMAFDFLKSTTPLILDADGDPNTTEDQTSIIPAADDQAQNDAAAKQLEGFRKALKPIFDYFADAARGDARLVREQIAIGWAFTITSAPEVVFNPDASLIPTPNDLLINPATGKLAFPLPAGIKCDDTTTWDALNPAGGDDMRIQAAFFCWMNGLDGFSATSEAGAAFTHPLEPTTVTATAARLFDLSATPPVEIAAVTPSWSDASATVSLIPSKPLTPGHRYFVALTSKLAGKVGTKTFAAVPSPFAAMLKLKTEIVKDGVNQLIGTLGDAQAAQVEGLRKAYAPVLDGFETLGAFTRSDLAAFFTFTVGTANEAIFDPTAGLIPFPNDVLIDQATGRLALPIGANEPEGLKAIKAGLNTLDGFSTLAPEATAFSLPLDPASLKITDIPASLLDLGTKLKASSIGIADITDVVATDPGTLGNLKVYNDFTAVFSTDSGQLILTPKSGKPLPPKRRYMVLLTDSLASVKQGDVTPPIVVAPTFFLARSQFPLANDAGKSLLPQVLSDANAAQLEVLRQSYKPIFDAMMILGVARENVTLFFTFTTLGTYQELQGLAALPAVAAPNVATTTPAAKLLATTDAAVTALFGTHPLSHIASVCVDCAVDAQILLGAPDLADPANPKMGHFQVDADGKPVFTAAKLPFLLIVPQGTKPADGFPVVLFQHGLNGSREDVTFVADDLAAKGLVVLSIDAPLHGDHPVRLAGTETGTGFFSADVFAVRDNIREAALDHRQMLLFIQQKLGAWLVAQGVPAGFVDTTKIRYLGDSLGGITGTVSVGINTEFDRAALVVAGGHMTNIFLKTQNVGFQKPLIDALAALGIAPLTPEFNQFITSAQLALDRADPQNYAILAKGADPAHPESRVLLVEAVGDEFIPNSTTEELRDALGVTAAAGFVAYPTDATATDKLCHDFFLGGCDATAFPKAAQAQTDARKRVVDFLGN